MVFITDNRRLVAKVYHKGVITPLRWAKLKKLTELGITSTSFCAPQHLLYEDSETDSKTARGDAHTHTHTRTHTHT